MKKIDSFILKEEHNEETNITSYSVVNAISDEVVCTFFNEKTLAYDYLKFINETTTLESYEFEEGDLDFEDPIIL